MNGKRKASAPSTRMIRMHILRMRLKERRPATKAVYGAKCSRLRSSAISEAAESLAATIESRSALQDQSAEKENCTQEIADGNRRVEDITDQCKRPRLGGFNSGLDLPNNLLMYVSSCVVDNFQRHQDEGEMTKSEGQHQIVEKSIDIEEGEEEETVAEDASVSSVTKCQRFSEAGKSDQEKDVQNTVERREGSCGGCRYKFVPGTLFKRKSNSTEDSRKSMNSDNSLNDNNKADNSLLSLKTEHNCSAEKVETKTLIADEISNRSYSPEAPQSSEAVITQSPESDSFIYLPMLPDSREPVLDDDNDSNAASLVPQRAEIVDKSHNRVCEIKDSVAEVDERMRRMRTILERLVGAVEKNTEMHQEEKEKLEIKVSKLENRATSVERDADLHLELLAAKYQKYFTGMFEKAISKCSALLFTSDLLALKGLCDRVYSKVKTRIEALESKSGLFDENLRKAIERNGVLELEVAQKNKDLATIQEALDYTNRCFDREKTLTINLRKVYRKIVSDLQGLLSAFEFLKRTVSKLSEFYRYDICSRETEVARRHTMTSFVTQEILPIKDVVVSHVERLEASLRNISDTFTHTCTNYDLSLLEASAKIAALESKALSVAKQSEDAEARAKAANETCQELRDELALKANYISDLEKQLEEAMNSNKFYESQLIESDRAIREIREKQGKCSLDLNQELKKIRLKYYKENALLKLRIEELEMKCSEKATDNSK